MWGAFVRRCWLPSDDAGRNAGDNARKNARKNASENASENASGSARARRWSLQAAPVVTPRRVAVTPTVTPRRAAVTPTVTPGYPASALCLISLEPAPVSRKGLSPRVARSIGQAGRRAGRWNMDGNGSREGTPSTFGAYVRRCFTVKQGVCGYPLVLARIRRRSPEYAQCPSARHLGTVGGMSHATQNAPQQTRRAPALPRWEARACTCPAVAKPAQECPTRTVALTVRGGTRDNAARAVRHEACPRYVGRADVDSTRSAAFPLRPPDALGSPHGFQLRGSSRLTARRRAPWLRVRSVGHSAAGSVSPMQGQHEAHNHYPRASDGERREPRASMYQRGGTLRSAAPPQTRRATPVREGSQP